jgi:hypothetical protein
MVVEFFVSFDVMKDTPPTPHVTVFWCAKNSRWGTTKASIAVGGAASEQGAKDMSMDSICSKV